MARQAAAAEGSRFSHLRDSSQRGMPQECIQQIAGLDQTISAGSANFFIEANTGRGSDGELLRFPELVRREPQDEPAPRPAASARGRCSGRSAPKIVIACIRVSDFHRRADSLSLWSDIPNPIISSLWTLVSNPPENSEILGSSRMESQAS